MFQTSVDEYSKVVEKDLPIYLASMPDPFSTGGIREYIKNHMPTDKYYPSMPLEWFDVAATTALIRNHKDTKDEYSVNSYLLEMLVTMFRVSMNKLGFLTDKDAQDIAEMFAYDRLVDNTYKALLFNDFSVVLSRFPYNHENKAWYSYMMPLLAYSHQSSEDVPNYVARNLARMINAYSITENTGEHARDVTCDILKPIEYFGNLIDKCKSDYNRYVHGNLINRYNYIKDIMIEFATVYLGCLLQRSASYESFGKIASEVVAVKYMRYQEISQIYYEKQLAKE